MTKQSCSVMVRKLVVVERASMPEQEEARICKLKAEKRTSKDFKGGRQVLLAVSCCVAKIPHSARAATSLDLCPLLCNKYLSFIPLRTLIIRNVIVLLC